MAFCASQKLSQSKRRCFIIHVYYSYNVLHGPYTDGGYILQLSLWDIRLQRPILTYKEHINDYKRCQSLVESSENLLVSGTHTCSELVEWKSVQRNIATF